MSAPEAGHGLGRPGLALALPPGRERGLGDLITRCDAPALIEGVRVEPFALWPDDRGYFAEVLRVGGGLAAGFPAATTQVSCALSYPGTVKAFHYHRHQTDLWQPSTGLLQVGLVDLRRDSASFGRRNTLYVGALRPWRVLIPPGVAHGYKVVGPEPAVLVYVTDRHYDPEDEGRLAHDDAGLAYDWETQRK